MNRDVLIGAIGEQLHKYTGVYKNFEPIHWGRSLFYLFHYKWEEAKIILKGKAEINRLRSQL